MAIVVGLQVENFKPIRAIDIRPDGNIVKIGGNNDQGKSSVLDAIWVALVGRSVAPPMPIRNGEEECRIRLDLGDLVITRRFTLKEGGKITDAVKVENADGLRYPRPQEVLDALLGAIGFDPFDFTKRKPDQQAAMLLELVPLPIDLERHALLDSSDFAKRRDVNRDAEQLKAQIDAIPEETDLPPLIDREAIADDLERAAETNSQIERDRAERDRRHTDIERIREAAQEGRSRAAERRAEAARLIAEAEELEANAKGRDESATQQEKELAALPALPAAVDTRALREQLDDADNIQRRYERQASRAKLVAAQVRLVEESDGYTKALAGRKHEREEALSKAKMPIDGLAFAINEQGKPILLYRGVPFEQASTAVQIRASTAIAMAANPELRVLRIKDGSLLDDGSMAILTEMANDNDFQLWIEVVGTGGVGIIIEDGSVKGAGEAAAAGAKTAEAPAAEEKPKKASAKKAAPKAEGPLL